jgi:hypothetical protein
MNGWRLGGKSMRADGSEERAMVRASRALAAVVLAVLPALPGAAQVTGYESLANWDALPLAKTGAAAHLNSSYDRDGGNLDWNWYPGYTRQLNEAADDGIAVTLLDVQGAGVLNRYWMPHATANDTRDITITVDEGLPTEAVISTESDPFLYGGDGDPHAALFEGPLVPTAAGGQVSYEPIGFTASLKVESINRQHLTSAQGGPVNNYSDRHYYQLNYTLYSNGASVQPYANSLDSSDPRTAARQQAVNVLNNVGQNPAGASGTSLEALTGAQAITPGQTVSLASLAAGQSGTVRRLNVRMDSPTDAGLADLRVRVRYDGEAEHAVDVPVGAFFGAASPSAPAYQSLPMGTDSDDGFYCYFPMPYRKGIAVELYNAGSGNVDIDGAAVEYEPGAVPADAGYFHAVYAESNPGSGKHQILSAAGPGHYVGNILTLKALDGDTDGLHRRILEGDETITVDGTNVLQGTGLEDAYSGGFYYNHVLDQNDDGDTVNPVADAEALSGLLLMDTVDDLASGQPDISSGILQVSQYRWLIPDLVPFEDGILVEIENYGGQDATFGSTAFYYVVPEPGVLALLWLGAGALLRKRRLSRGS